MPRKTDKRIRLIGSAKILIHKQGFNLTTLADIAQEADVPLGNVYYYFKTKDSIGETVILKRTKENADKLAKFDQLAQPESRISAYIQSNLEDLENIARYGCPIGGLCQELGKKGGKLADLAANILNETLEWCTKQFTLLGHGDIASNLALDLVANIQGMLLLTHTFKDPSFAKRQADKIVSSLENTLGMQLPPVTVTMPAQISTQEAEAIA